MELSSSGMRYRTWAGVVFSVVGLTLLVGSWFAIGAAGKWYSVSYWQGTPWPLSPMGVLIVSMTVTFLFCGLTEWIWSRLGPWRVFLLMACVFVVQVAVIRIMGFGTGQKMVSDYALAQAALEAGKVSCGHPVGVAYWHDYEILLSVLGMIFGPHLLTGQIVNALCVTLVVFPVYKLARRTCGGWLATLIVMLMGFSPVYLVYATMLTSEFLGATALLYALLALDVLMFNPGGAKRLLWHSVLCGVLLAISEMFKPLAILFLGGMVVCAAMTWLCGCRSKRSLVRLLLVCFLVFVAFGKAKEVLSAVCDSTAGEAARSSATGVVPWRGLVVGLNQASRGMWSAEISGLAHSMTDEQAREFVINRARAEYRDYPHLFGEKFKILYATDSWMGFWHNQTTGGTLPPVVSRVRDGGYLAAQWLFFAAAIGFLLFRGREWKDVFPVFFSALIVISFTLVIMVLEVQERYRVSVYPFYFLSLAGVGNVFFGIRSVWKRIVGK